MHSMTRPSTFPLYDKILGGSLAERLVELRTAGHSPTEIAFQLRPEISVSPETIRRWLRAIDAEGGAA